MSSAVAAPVVDLSPPAEIPFAYAPLVVSTDDIYDVPGRTLLITN